MAHINIPGFHHHAFLNFTQDPQRTQDIIDVQQALLQAPNRQDMIQWVDKSVRADQSFMKLFELRFFQKFPSNEEFARMPDGSLGRAVLKHLTDNGITLDFAGYDTEVFYQKMDTPVAYLGMRSFKFHDIYHAVLGLGTSPVDEYVLGSFLLGQFYSPYHMILLASGMVHVAVLDPKNIHNLMEKSHRYYELGKTSTFLPGFKFEDYWATPLADVRKIVNISVHE